MDIMEIIYVTNYETNVNLVIKKRCYCYQYESYEYIHVCL